MSTFKRETSLNAKLALDESRLLKIIPGNGGVTGIAVLNKKVYVVRKGSTQVDVYSNTTQTTTPLKITITGSKEIWAIIASPSHNSLYLSDVGLKVIHVYNLATNVATQWSVGGECYGLSLTSTGNVLVTLFDTTQIEEYKPEGDLIRVISLDSSMDNPLRSAQLSRDRLVVSHGWYARRERVCIVDMNGNIVQSSSAFPGSGIGQLNNPRDIAVDRHGNVLVADWGNGRIVLFSPSLSHLGYITVPGHQHSKLYALHLDHENVCLYLGEFEMAQDYHSKTNGSEFSGNIFILDVRAAR